MGWREFFLFGLHPGDMGNMSASLCQILMWRIKYGINTKIWGCSVMISSEVFQVMSGKSEVWVISEEYVVRDGWLWKLQKWIKTKGLCVNFMSNCKICHMIFKVGKMWSLRKKYKYIRATLHWWSKHYIFFYERHYYGSKMALW